MVGQTISHYKILSELGRGGMGVVYKAEDLKLKRQVALKFLRSELLEDPEHKERFLREAQAAAALDHPNICTVYEIDEADGQTFLSMAYLEGETVKEKIKARPLKVEDALDIAIQTAQGLQAAHEKGVVHRDIKSANLMVTPQGPDKFNVKVMDFGLAQLAERSQLTKTATMLGTPAYMSPEQSQCLPTDRRTDIWSLGVVIYEMVTGRLPFEGERQQAVLYAIANEEAEPITALRAGLPMDLESIVGKALAKDAAERYQHVEEMIVDLKSLSKKLAAGRSTILQPQAPGTAGGVAAGGAAGCAPAGCSALATSLTHSTIGAAGAGRCFTHPPGAAPARAAGARAFTPVRPGGRRRASPGGGGLSRRPAHRLHDPQGSERRAVDLGSRPSHTTQDRNRARSRLSVLVTRQ